MSKMLAGLVGAVTAAAAAGPAHAAGPAMQAKSYADLLKPVPNAVEVLRALDAQAAPEATVQEVQYYHHHHHHHYHRRYYHHHHHHHHYGRYGYGYGYRRY